MRERTEQKGGVLGANQVTLDNSISNFHIQLLVHIHDETHSMCLRQLIFFSCSNIRVHAKERADEVELISINSLQYGNSCMMPALFYAYATRIFLTTENPSVYRRLAYAEPGTCFASDMDWSLGSLAVSMGGLYRGRCFACRPRQAAAHS